MLMLASRGGMDRFVQLLLERRAAINRQDSNGATALTFAAAQGHTAVCQRLLWAGAQPGLSNHLGYCPVQFAQERGNEGCVKLLREAQANIDSPPPTPVGGIVWASL